MSSWTTRLKLLGSAFTTLAIGRDGEDCMDDGSWFGGDDEDDEGADDDDAERFFRTGEGLLIFDAETLLIERRRSCTSIAVQATAMESTHKGCV